MMMGLLSLTALIGAPIVAAFMAWRVYRGGPWHPSAWLMERVVIALIVGAAGFNGWLAMCEQIKEAIHP